MFDFQRLLSDCPFEGQVEWLGIRPKHRENIEEPESFSITMDEGILGDHYAGKSKKRQVTLFQAEYMEVLKKIMRIDIQYSQLRRNIAVSGINLNAFKSTVFVVGDVELQGTGYCHPCSRMNENLGPGGYHAMRGHGGITAKVIKSGTIHLGDKVTTLKD